MVSYKLKILGSIVLLILGGLSIATSVFSWQASQRLSWETIAGQTTISVSYSDRDYIGNTLEVYGGMITSIVGGILIMYAIGILLVK